MKKEIIYGSIVQLVRTLVCHIRGRGFKPRWNRHCLIVGWTIKLPLVRVVGE